MNYATQGVAPGNSEDQMCVIQIIGTTNRSENIHTRDKYAALTRKNELYNKSTKNMCDTTKLDNDNNTKDLKIYVWNIHGLNNHKISKDVSGTFLLEHDIIMLSETWNVKPSEDGYQEYELEGFQCIDIPRDFKHINALRGSGGLCIYIRKNIFNTGVIFHKHHKDIIAWFKLRKEYFNLKKDIFIAAVYIPPENSTHTLSDVFGILYTEIASLPDNCEVLICGDMNARTNNCPAVTLDEYTGSDGDLTSLMPVSQATGNTAFNVLKRHGCIFRSSKDIAKINNYGTELIHLCKTANLIMLNGRSGLDKDGKFSSIQPNGNSVTDYVLCTPGIFESIDKFKLHNKLPESDHVPITFNIRYNSATLDTANASVVKWDSISRYKWESESLIKFKEVLSNRQTDLFYTDFKDSVYNLDSASTVCKNYSMYIQNAMDQCFSKSISKRKMGKPTWFDKQCRLMRNEVVKTGKLDIAVQDNKDLLHQKNRQYNAMKQLKKRNYTKDCLSKIQHTYKTNRSLMWKTIIKLCPVQQNNNPSGNEFFEHFKSKSISETNPNFEYELERKAIQYLTYPNIHSNYNSLDCDLLNRNIELEEISKAIDKLKVSKAPGKDGVISEFLKFCKPTFSTDLTLLFNYIIEQRQFPEHWAEGLRNPIFKSGSRSSCNNFRGITVLSVFEKVFEIVILTRLEFLSEAFNKSDRHNGGFTKGCRTSDNNFIIQGLVQRQLHLGGKLIVIHVDFSRAFDSVNRAILFYKLNKAGFRGRVIDTLFDLYKKTTFCVKLNGKISESIHENIGVNQGSITSPFLFKEYLSDLKSYLDTSTGVSIGEEILVHELWADDLYMVSDHVKRSQKQLDGLKKFCSPNHMIANEIKTKFMVYGSKEEMNLHLNGNKLEQVDRYKSLGTILNIVQNVRGDIFKYNTEYLNNKARKAIFAIKQKIKSVGKLPPTHWFHIYESMIEPILLYGSDLWGVSRVCTANINKIYLWFMRIILNIKATTPNLITMGESGIIPPKTKCHINALLYFIRLNTMPAGSVVKHVFMELQRLHSIGYYNWYSRILELAKYYQLELTGLQFGENTKRNIKTRVKEAFILSWKSKILDITAHPSLRTYNLFKYDFVTEPYLSLIKKTKYVIALSRFRAGSHTLEIERGRYSNPRTPLHLRLCAICQEIEDEKHFLICCKIYEGERTTLFNKIDELYPVFIKFNNHQKFIFLMTNTNEQLVTWVAKFIHDAMHQRAVYHLQVN